MSSRSMLGVFMLNTTEMNMLWLKECCDEVTCCFLRFEFCINHNIAPSWRDWFITRVIQKLEVFFNPT